MYGGVPVSPHPDQDLLLSIILILAILVGMKWYVIVILVCVFLMTNDVEYLFMCSLAICISSLEKYVLKSFAYFLIGLFVFLLLSCKKSLYILASSPISDIWFANSFSYSVGCLFFFLIVSFEAQKLQKAQNLLNFDEVQFIYFFFFCCLCFWGCV